MEANILTVHWHDGEQPVYSAHFQPAQRGVASERLATGGGDNNVRLWRLVEREGDLKVDYLSTLSKHTQAVNVVRFDSCGQYIASGGDDGCCIIWCRSDQIVREFGADADDEAQESWILKSLCRSSSAEIYDLAWSPDSKYIITGSTDNHARIYDVSGKQVQQIAEHGHYVQGVAWDPRGKFLATQSADRSVHVYHLRRGSVESKPIVLQKSSRAELPSRQQSEVSVPEAVNINADTKSSTGSPQSLEYTTLKSSMLYHTESLRSFFRRLTFSPDGNLLLTPAGIFKNNTQDEDKDKEEHLNTVYIYSRHGLNKPPIAHLPGFKKPALVVSFSPVVYELDENSPNLFQLPYKMVYAVATVDSVHLFDTQSIQELGSVSSIHYGTLTDLAWDNDGMRLLVTSADGFCTSLQFSSASFGEKLSVDYHTLIPDDVVDEKIGTPKSTKKRVSGMSSSSSSSNTVASASTLASSPLAGPPVGISLKSADVESLMSRPAPVMNLIDNLVKKKQKTVPVVAEAVDTTGKADVEMKDAEPVVHTPAVKQKKRISPTPMTANPEAPCS